MSATWMLWVPLLVLPVILLLVFAGCVGDDAIISAEEKGKQEGADAAKKDAEQQKAAADQKKAADDAAKQAAAQYDAIIKAEPNIASYWRLNETQPGNWACLDSAPDTPQNGEYKNVAGVSRGESGALSLLRDPNDKAVEFDGVQGYVEIPYHGLLNPPLDFSLEAWVRVDPLAHGATPLVVASAYQADPASGKPQRGYVLEVIPPAAAGGVPMAQARLGGVGGLTTVQTPLNEAGLLNGWHHVVLTYSGGTKIVRLYINAADGKPDQEVVAAVPFAPNPAAAFRIAAGQAEAPGATPAPARFFAGRLDEVALYRAELSGVEVSQHFLAATTPA